MSGGQGRIRGIPSTRKASHLAYRLGWWMVFWWVGGIAVLVWPVRLVAGSLDATPVRGPYRQPRKILLFGGEVSADDMNFTNRSCPSGATDADHVPTDPVHFDNRGLEETRRLPGQTCPERHAPDRACAGGGSYRFDRVRSEGDQRPRDLDRAVAGDLGGRRPRARERERGQNGYRDKNEAA